MEASTHVSCGRCSERPHRTIETLMNAAQTGSANADAVVHVGKMAVRVNEWLVSMCMHVRLASVHAKPCACR